MKRNLIKTLVLFLIVAICSIHNSNEVLCYSGQNEFDILSLKASGTESCIRVSGTCEGDVSAILVEIFEIKADSSKELVTMETHQASNGTFSANINYAFKVGTTYLAYVINYEGTGEYKTVNLVPVATNNYSVVNTITK